MGKPDAAAVTSSSSGKEVTIATTTTLEKTVAVSINKGANVTIGASVENKQTQGLLELNLVREALLCRLPIEQFLMVLGSIRNLQKN